MTSLILSLTEYSAANELSLLDRVTGLLSNLKDLPHFENKPALLYNDTTS
jgi:hypothetical protein